MKYEPRMLFHRALFHVVMNAEQYSGSLSRYVDDLISIGDRQSLVLIRAWLGMKLGH